ncbi:DUF551 domain-containing protein [Cronobacter dublinensis]
MSEFTIANLQFIDDYDRVEPGEASRLAHELLALRERAEPVVTDYMALAFHHAITDGGAGSDDIDEIKTGLRAALANYTAPPAPVVSEWIACSERMPKIGDEIFYYCEDDGIRDCGIVGSSNFTGRGDPELFVHSEGFDLHLGADITHWMPLPEAPGKN